jgi:hypothetical protein
MISTIITVSTSPVIQINEKHWKNVEQNSKNIINKRIFVRRNMNNLIFTDYITEQIEKDVWKRTIVNFRAGDSHPYPY